MPLRASGSPRSLGRPESSGLGACRYSAIVPPQAPRFRGGHRIKRTRGVPAGVTPRPASGHSCRASRSLPYTRPRQRGRAAPTMTELADAFDAAFSKAVDLGNRIADKEKDADLWDIPGEQPVGDVPQIGVFFLVRDAVPEVDGLGKSRVKGVSKFGHGWRRPSPLAGPSIRQRT